MNLQDKTFAVLSDVHGNLEALEKVLKILKKKGISNIVFLGDALGYGADPVKCFTMLQDISSVFLMGNHEAMIIEPSQKKSCLCNESYEWTKEVIPSEIFEKLKELPFDYVNEKMGFYHATPNNSLCNWKYLNDLDDIIAAFDKLSNIISFYGHTHRPRVVIIGEEITDKLITRTTKFRIDCEKQRCCINPGSIGQSRDASTKLSLAICRFDGQYLDVRIERHRYNYLKAYLKVRINGCGADNANYLIREKWRKSIYENIGNWCEWFHRKKSMRIT
ncbi:Predicted phosphodiesterase [Butyrivibrio hungatei]|uniref:Predicted phosphodiesterase n=1 Tax=Butyrivibrio hungatei TaxID=185008 RepID=A0A1G5G599_9FIRM|nr:metallophosphoesterase family protein [Butyrivibrio hungatei]SCY46521.1 Predicted phosphodiesterase [Butyrivibrio hungatei]